MDDYWESFWLGGDAADRRNRARINDVAQAEASARSRLAEQMREQRGDLQAQLDRLTQAFVAMVEYEDTRGRLAEHADAAAVRKWAREVVPTLVVTGGAGLAALPAPAPVHDYWLSWAVRGVVADATAGPGASDAAELLARARQLDAERTDVLLVLLDAVRRRPHLGTAHLDDALPGADEVTNAGRQVWIALAEGRLGDPALTALEARLGSLLGSPAADVEARVRALVPEKTGVSAPQRAAQTLAALAPAGRRAATPDASGPEDPLAETLRALVDEGAPGEREILRQMAGVRARMGFVPDQVVPQQWDAPAGRVLDLLFDDLTGPDEGRRRLATRLLGPSLLPVVDTLRREAADGGEPTASVRIAGHTVTIGADGTPEDGWRERVEAAVRAGSVVTPVRLIAAVVAFVVAVVGLALVLVAPIWLLLTVLGGATGALLLIQDSGWRTSSADSIRRRMRSADDEMESTLREEATRRAALAAARAEADRAAGDVVEALTSATGHPGTVPAAAPVPA